MGPEISWRILADRALREYGMANPQVEFILAATLNPYTVKHGELLTVNANSSEPDPWVLVWGETYPMQPIAG